MYPLALILTAIGGINWGLIALANFNLVDQLFGAGSITSTIIYGLVGISAVYVLVSYLADLGRSGNLNQTRDKQPAHSTQYPSRG